MQSITLSQISSDPGAFIRRMEDGESMTVVDGDRVVAEVKPVRAVLESGLRPYGLAAGTFVVPDDFTEPLPDAILADFEGR